MNWKLILSLSLFGVLMGAASVLGLTRSLEPMLWPLIGIFCAIWIVKKQACRRFAHGFLTGAIGGGIAPLLQGLFVSTYLSNNPAAAASFAQLPQGISARIFFCILVLPIAVSSGLVLGTLTWVAGKK